MKNNIEKGLKKLFDYQKFEGNSKLEQTIKDTSRNSTLLSDLQLADAKGAAGNVKYIYCNTCKETRLMALGPKNGGFYWHCPVCNSDIER